MTTSFLFLSTFLGATVLSQKQLIAPEFDPVHVRAQHTQKPQKETGVKSAQYQERTNARAFIRTVKGVAASGICSALLRGQ